MKRSLLLLSALLFCLASSAAWASSKDGNPAQSRIITVLVNVSAKGKVTDVAPAYKLRPSFVRVIQATLDKMITEPAQNHGSPIPCQFVANLRMNLIPVADGKYRMSFDYISSKPLPSGSWYWVKTHDHRLALWNQSANDLINLAKFESGMSARQAVDARNEAMFDQHQGFVNRYGSGH